MSMELCPSVDQNSKPSAEQTKIGWAVILPGTESNIVSALFTKTSGNNYENLCDVRQNICTAPISTLPKTTFSNHFESKCLCISVYLHKKTLFQRRRKLLSRGRWGSGGGVEAEQLTQFTVWAS